MAKRQPFINTGDYTIFLTEMNPPLYHSLHYLECHAPDVGMALLKSNVNAVQWHIPASKPVQRILPKTFACKSKY